MTKPFLEKSCLFSFVLASKSPHFQYFATGNSVNICYLYHKQYHETKSSPVFVSMVDGLKTTITTPDTSLNQTAVFT